MSTDEISKKELIESDSVLTSPNLDLLDFPKLEYNKELNEFFSSDFTTSSSAGSKYVTKHTKLGKGAAGSTYTCSVKNFKDVLAIKQLKRNDYSLNEYEALCFLKDKMLEGKYPPFYVFMYYSYTQGPFRYLVMEYADKCLDTYMTEYDLSTEKYFEIFEKVTYAVKYLEELEFNHGDLWTENVMLKWDLDEVELDIPEEDRIINIKLIDYDASYATPDKTEGYNITSPALGAGDDFRTSFILGYDLNRFFDSIYYQYNEFITQKYNNKLKKYLKKNPKARNKPIPEDLELSSDSSDREFDDCNPIFPDEIIDFIESLDPLDPNDFLALTVEQQKEMSAIHVISILNNE